MIASSNAALGYTLEAYAVTLTQQEMLDLRDALSRSLATVRFSERVSASRRAGLLMRSNTAINGTQSQSEPIAKHLKHDYFKN